MINLPANQLETKKAPEANQKIHWPMPITIDLNSFIKKSSIPQYNTKTGLKSRPKEAVWQIK
jgi:hypothetical protein